MWEKLGAKIFVVLTTYNPRRPIGLHSRATRQALQRFSNTPTFTFCQPSAFHTTPIRLHIPFCIIQCMHAKRRIALYTYNISMGICSLSVSFHVLPNVYPPRLHPSHPAASPASVPPPQLNQTLYFIQCMLHAAACMIQTSVNP